MTGKHVAIITIGFIAIILFMIPTTSLVGILLVGLILGSFLHRHIDYILCALGNKLDTMIRERGKDK